MYFLFDLSQTMEDTLADLAIIAKDLANELALITSDRFFGFGIFREKPTPPFDVRRDYDYDFEHHMQLNENINEFIENVKTTVNIQGNIDNPEAGLDALMQVLLCTEDIGWRTGATHIIIYISDATPHTAGTGVFGGTWKPYDHTCQLKPKGTKKVYSSLDHDYPSFSAVSYQLKKLEKFLILGIKDYIKNYYLYLNSTMTLEANIGVINDKQQAASENLKNLILNTYKDIKDKMTITTVVSSDNLDITLKFAKNSDCESQGEPGLEISCNKVKVDQKIRFIAEVTMKEGACKTGNTQFDVKVFGQNSQLNVIIEPDCICDCMKSPNTSRNDLFCTGRGMEKCKTCFCNEGFGGDRCECKLDSGLQDVTDDQEKCISKNGQICGNRGVCSCGSCSCSGSFYGKHCECDKLKCNCGDHGSCICVDGVETCQCNSGWELDETGSCGCSTTAVDNCIDPFTNNLCNNNGKCKCNKCTECGNFGGYYCQQPHSSELVDIQRRSCDILSPCILLDTFAHILSKSGKETDKYLLNDLESDCDTTQIKKNNRIQCFWTLDINPESVISSDTGEVVEFEETTEECKAVIISDFNQYQECTTYFKNCKFTFWHDSQNGVDGYSKEDLDRKISIFIKYYNKTDNPMIQFNDEVDLDYSLTPVLCPSFVDKWVIISSVGGVVLFVFISCFIVYFVLINLYDRWEYERFKKDAAMAWDIGNVQENQISDEKRKTKFAERVRNRMSRMSVRS